MERVNLLICDLDGTLLGDDSELDRFARWYAQSRERFYLAYSSGRFVESILESIAATSLPEPDAVIGGVGTEIYDMATAKRAPMWPPLLLGWNPHIVRAICESHRELTPQPARFTSYHKVSYYGRDLSESFIARLVQRMAGFGLQASAIYSSDRDLDITPGNIHKGAAAAFLAGRWKINPNRVFVAGDSGNDAAMFHMGFRGIVVGNAHAELRSIVAPYIYRATAEFAAGVLEGLDHWLQAPSNDFATIDRLRGGPDASRDRLG